MREYRFRQINRERERKTSVLFFKVASTFVTTGPTRKQPSGHSNNCANSSKSAASRVLNFNQKLNFINTTPESIPLQAIKLSFTHYLSELT